MQHRPLFTERELLPELNNLPLENAGIKLKILEDWKRGLASGKILAQNEKKLQSEFLNKIFGEVLGYSYEKHLDTWQLDNELKVDFDGRTPDGALGYFEFVDGQNRNDVRAIIELKGPLANLDKKQNRKDFPGTAVEQGFSYVPKLTRPCEWVIVSNCQEIRLYRYSQGMTQYERFDLLSLSDPAEFRRFCFLLQKDRLFLRTTKSAMDGLFEKREKTLKTITNEFYQRYKIQREGLFTQFRRDNPAVLPNELFRCTQKLIDRLIFMCFARDLRLVDNVLQKVRTAADLSYGQTDDKIWQELRRAFLAFDRGFVQKNIPPFNGGLFRADETLDALDVRDFRLSDLMDFLGSYDFQGQLNVNVLGHIFEQSIADIEEIKARLAAEEPLALADGVGTLS